MVVKFGAATFKKLEDTLADKSNARLRGKISQFKALNRFLDGELIRTSREVKIYQDRNLLEIFEENQELKAKLEKLSGVQEQLNEAHAKVGEQAKKIAKISELENGLKKAQEDLEKAREESKAEKLRADEEIQNLKEERAVLTDKPAFVALAGFQC